MGVTNAFIELFKQGVIYRGEKMLHFCPTLQSVVSDIEVDWKVRPHSQSHPQDIAKRQKMKLPSGEEVEVGVIYDIKYPIAGREGCSDQYLKISTTRPETLFGDTAIAINSADAYHMVLAARGWHA